MTEEPKLISQTKFYKKGLLFGHISSGGGIVPMENGFAIQFCANEQYVQINLLHYGVGKPVPHQTWNKTKVVKETVIKEVVKKPKGRRVEIKKDVQQGTLM